MTRINVGIKPADLEGKHLIAEHREIKRIPNVISKGKYNLAGQPSVFKLGTGHVKFFYTRLLYLKNRYEELYNECLKRGYNVSYYGNAWNDMPKELMNDYLPTEEDIKIIQERLDDKRRIKESRIT
jgi:deoxyribonuclease (pyrimidine dimer)